MGWIVWIFVMTSEIRVCVCARVYRDFKIEDGRAEIPLNVLVQGDVLVVIYHARATLGGRLQAKVYTHTVHPVPSSE